MILFQHNDSTLCMHNLYCGVLELPTSRSNLNYRLSNTYQFGNIVKSRNPLLLEYARLHIDVPVHCRNTVMYAPAILCSRTVYLPSPPPRPSPTHVPALVRLPRPNSTVDLLFRSSIPVVSYSRDPSSFSRALIYGSSFLPL